MRKPFTKESGAYGKPSRLGVPQSGKAKRAAAISSANRHRPKKGVTLSVMPTKESTPLMPLYSASNDHHRIGIDKVFLNGVPVGGVVECQTGNDGWVDVNTGRIIDNEEWEVERKHGIVSVTIKEGWSHIGDG